MKNTGQPFGQSWVRSVLGGMVVPMLIASVSGVPLMAAEPPAGRVVSKHIRDAILDDFRWDKRVAHPSAPEASIEVEPGVVVLPDFQVIGKRDTARVKRDDITDKTKAAPLVLGSGITEVRGKKFTMRTQKLFYIPIGWKIAW